MNETQSAVAQTRGDICRAIFAREAVLWMTAYLMAWGVAALVVRFAWTGQTPELLWGLAGLPGVVLVAWRRARAKTPGLEQVRTMLDAMSGAGGLLLIQGQEAAEAWAPKVPKLARPGFGWRDRQAVWFLVVAVVFVGAAVGVPDPDVTSDPVKMRLDSATQGTKEQIDALSKEPVVPQEKLAELKKQIERVEDEAMGNNPAKTWEALDQLRRAVQQTGDEAGMNLASLSMTAQGLEALSKALSGALENPKTQAIAVKALMDMAQVLEREAAEKPEIKAALANAGNWKENGLTPEQVKQIEKAMGKLDAQARQRLENLANQGLGQGEKKEGGQGQGEKGNGGQQALKDFLDNENIPDALKEACEAGGEGGVGRGPGAAKLTFKDMESPEVLNALAPESLPEGRKDANDAKLVSMSAEKPKEDPEGEGSTQGVLVKSANQGGEANRQELLPIHKQAVKRYFERKE